MAQAETDIVHTIMKDASQQGGRLFKNVRGLFYTKDSVLALIAAVQTGDFKLMAAAVRNLRQVKGGIQCAGASDLWGFRPLLITPGMVGRTFAVFSVVEVKTAIGAASEEQTHFLGFVAKNGGFSGIARSPEDARKIMNFPID